MRNEILIVSKNKMKKKGGKKENCETKLTRLKKEQSQI